MSTSRKNWDQYVVHAERVARSPGFCDLRDRIVALAAPAAGEAAVDVGAGTGLLALNLAVHADRVWAIDISASMASYLETKALSAGFDNVRVAVASAESLPIVDRAVDLVVSNYCFHHMDEEGKRRALAETMRVLRPGGRLVIGDMMFALALAEARNRAVVGEKVRAMVRMGGPGVIRLIKNGMRLVAGRWERPAAAEWWRSALQDEGFTDVQVTTLDHEGGIAFGRRPMDH